MKFETQSQGLKFAFLGGWKKLNTWEFYVDVHYFCLPSFFFCSYTEYALCVSDVTDPRVTHICGHSKWYRND